jgi:hypothetical protein
MREPEIWPSMSKGPVVPPELGPTTEQPTVGRPLAELIERADRLTADEIAALDRAFRNTPAIGLAWTWAYGGEVMWANCYDYEGNWDQLDALKANLDDARAAVWSAAVAAKVPGSDDPGRIELERRWTSIRVNPTLARWSEAADEVLAAPGPTWGAALAVEAAILAFAGGHLDPDRALIRPWEEVIERTIFGVPEKRWWPWTWPPELTSSTGNRDTPS